MAIYAGPEIVNDGLVLHLDAANTRSYPGSGTSWNDLVSNNNGTMTNGPVYSSTNNGIVSFDGIDDYVDCGPATFLGPSLTGLTVSCWYKVGKRTAQMVAENGTNFTTNTFYMAVENASSLTFEVYGSSHDAVYCNFVYDLGVWYNIVGTWSPNNRVEIYANGILSSGSRVGSVQSSLRSGNTNLLLGQRPGPSIPFEGSISNFSIYNSALSEVEVKQNFEATRSRYGI